RICSVSHANSQSRDAQSRDAQSIAAPVQVSERVPALDTLRGFAVLGILLMNIWSFAGPQAIYDYPVAAADWGGAPVATWAVMHTLFEGSQRALFSLLFGAGMLLMVTRLDAAATTIRAGRIYYRRLVFLMLFGLFDLFVLLWPADIIFVYGVCGLALYPLRKCKPVTLLALALLVFAAHAGLRALDWQEAQRLQAVYSQYEVNPALAEDERVAADIKDWEAKVARARPDLNDPKLQENMRITRSGDLGEFLRLKLQTSLVLLIVLGLKVMLLDSLGAMLVGMALLKLGVLTLQVPTRVYVLMLVCGYGIGLPIAAWEAAALLATDFDPLLKARNLIHYDIRRLAVALGHLSAIMLVCRAFPTSALVTRLAPVGRMALTNYLAQSMLCGLLFYSVGFGLYAQFTGYYLWLLVLCIWAVLIVFSNAWLQRYRFGPFEWLWRSLTYKQRQPMRLGSE
ncbi:MAG: DUF418 domain-containing protein, partial [Gammaproteobacteria bacterium]